MNEFKLIFDIKKLNARSVKANPKQYKIILRETNNGLAELTRSEINDIRYAL